METEYFFNKEKNKYILSVKIIPFAGIKAPKKKIIAEFEKEIEAMAAKKVSNILFNENFLPTDCQINNWIQQKMQM